MQRSCQEAARFTQTHCCEHSPGSNSVEVAQRLHETDVIELANGNAWFWRGHAFWVRLMAAKLPSCGEAIQLGIVKLRLSQQALPCFFDRSQRCSPLWTGT